MFVVPSFSRNTAYPRPAAIPRQQQTRLDIAGTKRNQISKLATKIREEPSRKEVVVQLDGVLNDFDVARTSLRFRGTRIH